MPRSALTRFLDNAPALFKPGERYAPEIPKEVIEEYSLHDIVDEIKNVDPLDDYVGEKVDFLGQVYLKKFDAIKPDDAAAHEKAAGVVDKVVRCYAVDGGEVWRDMQLDDLDKQTDQAEPKQRGFLKKLFKP